MKTIIALLCLALLGTGCNAKNPLSQGEKQKGDQDTIQGLQDVMAVQPAKLPVNFERRSASFKDGRTVDLVIARLPKDGWAWSMQNDPQAPKKVNAWRQELKSNLVINGSYFTETNQPSGFYKVGSKNKRIKLPNSNQDKGYTGLVGVIDGKLELGYLPYLRLESRVIEYDSVFLSFPTLLADEKNLVEKDSGKFSSRTAVAQNQAGDIFVIITEKGNISLFELAQWLESQPEKFQTAINMDGGPSSGISYSANDETYDLSSSAVPNVLSARIIQ